MLKVSAKRRYKMYMWLVYVPVTVAIINQVVFQ